MMKRSKPVSSQKGSEDWENASGSGWETAKSSGFAPQWKPAKKDESVIFCPIKVRIIPKGKNMDNEGVGVDCRLLGGNSESFFRRDVKTGIANGETFSIALSFALNGEDGLAIHEVHPKGKLGTARLSTLADYISKNNLAMRIVFGGQIKSGKRRMNIFDLQTPKGALQAAFSEKANKK